MIPFRTRRVTDGLKGGRTRLRGRRLRSNMTVDPVPLRSSPPIFAAKHPSCVCIFAVSTLCSISTW